MKNIIATILIFTSFIFYAQVGKTDKIPKANRKYVAWISPSKATHLYGLMFNFWYKDKEDSTVTFPKIYGAEINLNLIGIIGPFFSILATFEVAQQQNAVEESIDSLNISKFKKVNGLELAIINMEPTIINGLDINLSGSQESVTNGVTISIAMNRHYITNGLTIGLSNYDRKCSGIQIGLINSTAKLKGMQFGLWNINQKRSLPFINWCFKQ